MPTSIVLTRGHLEVICTHCYTLNIFLQILPKVPCFSDPSLSSCFDYDAKDDAKEEAELLTQIKIEEQTLQTSLSGKEMKQASILAYMAPKTNLSLEREEKKESTQELAVEVKDSVQTISSAPAEVKEEVENISFAPAEVEEDVKNISFTLAEVEEDVETIISTPAKVKGEVINISSSPAEIKKDVKNTSSAPAEVTKDVKNTSSAPAAQVKENVNKDSSFRKPLNPSVEGKTGPEDSSKKTDPVDASSMKTSSTEPPPLAAAASGEKQQTSDCESLLKYRHQKPPPPPAPHKVNKITFSTDSSIMQSLCRPPTHSPLPITTMKNSSVCQTCHVFGQDAKKPLVVYCPCCKHVPSFCSTNHFDEWHVFTHNWVIIPPTIGNNKPRMTCKMCPNKNFTRYYCPGCQDETGFCSLKHYELVHKTASPGDRDGDVNLEKSAKRKEGLKAGAPADAPPKEGKEEVVVVSSSSLGAAAASTNPVIDVASGSQLSGKKSATHLLKQVRIPKFSGPKDNNSVEDTSSRSPAVVTTPSSSTPAAGKLLHEAEQHSKGLAPPTPAETEKGNLNSQNYDIPVL